MEKSDASNYYLYKLKKTSTIYTMYIIKIEKTGVFSIYL